MYNGQWARFLSPRLSPLALPHSMTDSNTACETFEAVRTSTILARTSLQFLTLAQLLMLKDDLHKTLAVVDGQIRADLEAPGMFAKNLFERLTTHSCFTGDRRVIIDSSDWEGTSDEEEEEEIEGGNTAGSK